MENENGFESTFEYVIFKIDINQKTIDEFDNETLFMNIYLFYCFSRYLSPYYKWEKEALKRLKENIILKWPKETFGNVFVFIELLSRGFKEVNPTGYFWNSEDYFEHLFKSDILKDNLICKRIFKKGKCIR